MERWEQEKHGRISRTYRLSRPLARRINARAKALHLWPSDLVRFLLADGLDRLEAGELTIPTQPAWRHVIMEEDES